MNRTCLAAITVLFLAGGASLGAHHSIVAFYQIDRTETIDGEIVELRWQNPHSLLYLDAKNSSGEPQRYIVEWEAGLQLMRQGVNHDTLRPGDRVVITGNPSRRPDNHMLHLRTIVRPKDGWRWHGAFE